MINYAYTSSLLLWRWPPLHEWVIPVILNQQKYVTRQYSQPSLLPCYKALSPILFDQVQKWASSPILSQLNKSFVGHLHRCISSINAHNAFFLTKLHSPSKDSQRNAIWKRLVLFTSILSAHIYQIKKHESPSTNLHPAFSSNYIIII